MDNENIHIETSRGSSRYSGLVGQKGSATAPKPDVVSICSETCMQNMRGHIAARTLDWPGKTKMFVLFLFFFPENCPELAVLLVIRIFR